jgi:uncharacterized protein YhfF
VDFEHAFEEATGLPAPGARFAFGDGPELADELSSLVVSGRKRATAMLLAEVELSDESMPQPGELYTVLDGAGAPVAVIRLTAVDVVPYAEVGEEFAFEEGEDDRTLASWRVAHRSFFGRRCTALGIDFSEDLPVVCERFEKLWPDPTT